MTNKLHDVMIYIIGGILTITLNYLVYFFFLQRGINYLDANAVAWLSALIFSYVINRKVVFHSTQIWHKELLSFCSMSFPTLLVETFVLYGVVDCLHRSAAITKIPIGLISITATCLIYRYKIAAGNAGQYN